MNHRRVVVFAPAPIPIGQPIEVHLMVARGGAAVCVRDLTTGILYGGGGIFGEAADDAQIDGHRQDFRRSQPGPRVRVENTYRGRVVECVIANVAQVEGHAPCTSFVVEVPESPPEPYRG
jgi:hypothetical protein